MRSANARYLALALAVAAGLAALHGCGDTDSADRVHDLRLLAMRAEPPEQELKLGFSIPAGLLDAGSAPRDGGGLSLDGGLGFDAGGLFDLDGGLDICLIIGLVSDGGIVVPQGFDAGLPADFDAGCAAGPQLVQPVTVTALVADPTGAGRPIHYAWSTCAHLNSQNRCETDTPAYQLLQEGDLPGGLSNELSVTFTPSLALLSQAVKLDQLKGFGGLPLPVQLRIAAGNEKVVGYKYVVFTPRVGAHPVVPNTNPAIAALLFNGASWGPGDLPTLVNNQKLAEQNAGRDPADRVDAGNLVVPTFDAGAEEDYVRIKYDLTTEVKLKEALRFNFFATGGTFSRAQTGGGDNIVTGQKARFDTSWSPDPDQKEQDVTVWVVVRDGRGGENWTVRKAHYAP